MLWKCFAENCAMASMNVTPLDTVLVVQENAFSMINGLKEMNPQKWKATVTRHTSHAHVTSFIVV